jgi:acyl-coenzyme A thioesterase PaaI-like protein
MSEERIHEPVGMMGRHVLTQVGAHADDSCVEGLHLHLGPALFDTDGQVTFGVLGAFLDLASSQPEGIPLGRPFVHADMTTHRLAAPQGELLLARTAAARIGGRTAVVEVELVDEVGVRVAYSSQQLTFMGAPPRQSTEGRAAFRRMFLSMFRGEVSLPGPLNDVLGIEPVPGPGGAPAWRMPHRDLSRNGFGGLHGGVANALVDAAASGVVAGNARGGAGESAGCLSAALRYLVPGTAGPFRADPTILGVEDGQALVRVAIVDEGAEEKLIILAEARVRVAAG